MRPISLDLGVAAIVVKNSQILLVQEESFILIVFKELNSLYFIFHEKSLHNTKKIFLKQKKRKKRKKRKTKKNEMKELIIHKSDIIKIE